jgi:hypothetical protein
MQQQISSRKPHPTAIASHPTAFSTSLAIHSAIHHTPVIRRTTEKHYNDNNDNYNAINQMIMSVFFSCSYQSASQIIDIIL